jgi:transporter family-2 protein
MERFSTLAAISAVLLALAAGGVMALQPAVNGRLASQCSHPLQASILSFATGLLALIVVGLCLRVGVPSVDKLQTLPLWAWGGGVLGTYMVTVSLLVAPKLGATRWIALVLTGQIVLSLILDHFGLIGYARQAFSWTRAAGVLFLVVGVLIVMRT